MFGSAPIVVQVLRNGIVESEHAVDAVVADLDGSIVACAGSPHPTAYLRSSLKPIQAAVSLDHGWNPNDEREVAVACASHNAEPEHLEFVRSILSSAGLDEQALQCPPAYPMDAATAAKVGSPARLYRDCSGKHAAFLAAAVAAGFSTTAYLSPQHPLQIAIMDRVRALGGRVQQIGVDGCGAPTPAASLLHCALVFGRGIAASPSVADAMRNRPFFVAGTGRFDTDVMSASTSGVVSKQGAEGIVCFTSVASGRCGALKARDGSGRGIPPATLAVLSEIGLISPEEMQALQVHAAPPVLGGGTPQGTLAIRPE